MAYDSAATRARLLDAAYAEFVERGLAGARVDRIAAAASANKQAIYAYFGSKDALFDAVLGGRLQVLTEVVPFTPDDLPGYAGALFDEFVADPGLLRLTQWKALERPEATDLELASHITKAQALADARGTDARDTQARDTDAGGETSGTDLERGMDALMLALAVAQAWSVTAPAIRNPAASDEKARLARHRAAVVAAVRAVAWSLLG
jgi:AcrR family transcriptional regulator